MMIEILENFVRIQYAYAKKTDRYDTINAYFHNAFGATSFAMDITETEEEYNELMRFWDDWKEKFEAILWNRGEKND